MEKGYFEPIIEYGITSIKLRHHNIAPFCRCFSVHWHNTMEFLRVKSGKFYVEYASKIIEAHPGQLVLIPPKISHEGYTLDEGVEYDVLMIDLQAYYNKTKICTDILSAIFDGSATVEQVTSNKDIINCVDKICNDNTFETFATVSLVYQLLDLIYQNKIVKTPNSSKNAIVEKIIEYIDKHKTEKINLHMLCERFGYTAPHLCRKFKEVTGLSPMEYLKICRLELARNKIISTNETINDIALSCGFSDANYFTRYFKKHFGVVPTQYRK